MSKVVVGVTTFRRPRMLEQALRALEALDINADVRVLVADNDAEAAGGMAVVARLQAAGYRFPLSAILVPERGFTHGRNAIVEHAFLSDGADFVVTMDDDQVPQPGWLEALLNMQAQTGADVVGPAVVPKFESRAPKWARTSQVYNRDTTVAGPVDILYGDGGTMLSRRLVELLPMPWYDHAFGMSGGADTDLYRRMKARGARFARAPAAVIHEVYPQSRVRLSWALQRAYRIGNTDMRIALKQQGARRVALPELVKIGGAFVAAPLLVCISLGRPGRQVDALCKLARACGKVTAVLGKRHDEYAVTHGG